MQCLRICDQVVVECSYVTSVVLEVDGEEKIFTASVID